MPEHRHKWGRSQEQQIKHLAKFLAGQDPRMSPSPACVLCDVERCSGKVPLRNGQEYGCGLPRAHEGQCRNDLIPVAERYW